MALTDYSIDTSGTPQEMQRRQALADLLMQKGMDTSPAAGGKNGAWLTALNRGLAGALGGYQSGQAREEDRAGRASVNYSGYASGASPLGNALISPQAPPDGTAAASSIKPDIAGKIIYSNDEPSPLDPPSGQDRKNLQMAIIGEAANEPQLGKTGVASVVRTRAVDGGYGGDTPTGVVTAPNQFEPFNTPEGRARMARALADPKQLASADAAIASAYGEGGKAPEDPTGGMTHFYSPGGQAAMGRPAPAWAGGDSVTIGGHVFNSPDDATPPNAQPAQGQLPAQVAGPVIPDSKPPAKFGPEWAAETIRNPYAPAALKQVAAGILTSQTKQESHRQETDAQGNIWDVNNLTGQKTVALKSSDSKEKNDGLISLGAGSEVFDTKNRSVVHKNEVPHDATIDDKTSQAMADQYLAGDRTVLQNLGRGAQGAANIVKLRQTIQQRAVDAGVDPKGIVNNFNEQAGALAGQRAVGTRAANISLAANEANNMIPIALDASDKLPRTQWMPWNQMVQAAQKGSSSPELASFVAATNSLVNSYVRAVSPSGVPTDSMRQHAYDMLNAAQGPQAYKSVVNTMQLEMKAALSAPAQVRKELRKGNDAEGEPAVPSVPQGAPVAQIDPVEAEMRRRGLLK